MIATSPGKSRGSKLQVITWIFLVRHDPPIGVNPVDIHGFQPPWKSLTDFALHDLDRMDPNSPQFQHLVGQVTIDSPSTLNFIISEINTQVQF